MSKSLETMLPNPAGPAAARVQQSQDPVPDRAADPALSSPRAGAGARALWASVMLAAVALAGAAGSAALGRVEEYRLSRMTDPEFAAALAAPPQRPSVDWLEYASERALLLSSPDVAQSRRLALAAVEADPKRAFAWARLAYLDAHNGTAGPAVFEHLQRSIDACPACDESLIRWRLNFVLKHWDAAPEAIRTAVFSHAAALAPSPVNEDFLASARIRSNAAGLPFDASLAAALAEVKGAAPAAPGRRQ